MTAGHELQPGRSGNYRNAQISDEIVVTEDSSSTQAKIPSSQTNNRDSPCGLRMFPTNGMMFGSNCTALIRIANAGEARLLFQPSKGFQHKSVKPGDDLLRDVVKLTKTPNVSPRC